LTRSIAAARDALTRSIAAARDALTRSIAAARGERAAGPSDWTLRAIGPSALRDARSLGAAADAVGGGVWAAAFGAREDEDEEDARRETRGGDGAAPEVVEGFRRFWKSGASGRVFAPRVWERRGAISPEPNGAAAARDVAVPRPGEGRRPPGTAAGSFAFDSFETPAGGSSGLGGGERNAGGAPRGFSLSSALRAASRSRRSRSRRRTDSPYTERRRCGENPPAGELGVLPPTASAFARARAGLGDARNFTFSRAGAGLAPRAANRSRAARSASPRPAARVASVASRSAGPRHGGRRSDSARGGEASDADGAAAASLRALRGVRGGGRGAAGARSTKIGFARADSDASRISIARADSDASRIGIARADSDASRIGIARADSDASRIGIARADSDASRIGIARADSDASRIGIARASGGGGGGGARGALAPGAVHDVARVAGSNQYRRPVAGHVASRHASGGSGSDAFRAEAETRRRLEATLRAAEGLRRASAAPAAILAPGASPPSAAASSAGARLASVSPRENLEAAAAAYASHGFVADGSAARRGIIIRGAAGDAEPRGVVPRSEEAASASAAAAAAARSAATSAGAGRGTSAGRSQDASRVRTLQK
jgi:hypothetical protein